MSVWVSLGVGVFEFGCSALFAIKVGQRIGTSTFMLGLFWIGRCGLDLVQSAFAWSCRRSSPWLAHARVLKASRRQGSLPALRVSVSAINAPVVACQVCRASATPGCAVAFDAATPPQLANVLRRRACVITGWRALRTWEVCARLVSLVIHGQPLGWMCGGPPHEEGCKALVRGASDGSC